MMKMCHRFIPLLFLLLLLLRCDQYTGYNFDADSPQQTAKIYGIVENTFTNDPVINAFIRIGNLTTYSDNSGEYSVLYPLQTEEERDKPIPVVVEANNFFPFETSIIIYPNSTKLDIPLEYGAPLIKQNAFVYTVYQLDPIYICQAIIFDYQGIDDIDTVQATFYYAKGDTDVISFKVMMDHIQNISDNTAYYQKIARVNAGEWILRTRYDIRVTDKEGFSDFVSDFNNLRAPDTFIFPPNLP
jgi:hypothetical protein